MKASDLRKKLPSNVIEFENESGDNGNYDEINANMETSCDTSHVVKFLSNLLLLPTFLSLISFSLYWAIFSQNMRQDHIHD